MMSSLSNLGSIFFDISIYTFLTFIFTFSSDSFKSAIIILELGIEGLEPDPSFGSHFFQNLTSLHLGYFTFNKKQTNQNINWNILKKTQTEKSTEYVKLLKMEKPLKCIIDGTSGKGVILQK